MADVTQDFYDRLGPWKESDDQGHVRVLGDAFVHGLQPMEDVVRDDPTTGAPGWSIIMDADRAPIEWLPWLGQFIGARDIQPTSEYRPVLKEARGFRRGSINAIAAAVRRFLTGTQTVYLIERDGSPYRLTVITFENETADPAALVAEVGGRHIPAGIVTTFLQVPPISYGVVSGAYASYTALIAAEATYADMATGV